MEAVVGYVAGLVAAIVAGEMLLALLPDGNMKRFAQVAVGLLIAVMLIQPLKSLSGAEVSLPVQSHMEEKIQIKSAGEIIMDVYNSQLENRNE